MSKDKKEQQLSVEIITQLKDLWEKESQCRERLYRQQLERTVEVLNQTKHSFRSKQLKSLREEIESVLKSN